jgi:hypothetical protein
MILCVVLAWLVHVWFCWLMLPRHDNIHRMMSFVSILCEMHIRMHSHNRIDREPNGLSDPFEEGLVDRPTLFLGSDHPVEG